MCFCSPLGVVTGKRCISISSVSRIPLSLSLYRVPNVVLPPSDGYAQLRKRFGPDSFLVTGPFHAIMTAVTPTDYTGGSPFYDVFNKGINEMSDFFANAGIPGIGNGEEAIPPPQV